MSGGRDQTLFPVGSWLRRAWSPALFAYVLKWLVLGSLTGLLAGSASAFFLTSLDWAAEMRDAHPWLLFLLPAGGALVAFLYKQYGGDASRGMNLILDEIHEGKGAVPLRMAPLVLFGTIVTHLFGGSAGREGTAVQMGGSFAEAVGKLFRLKAADRRMLLLCGIAAGFGSVFGTPLAGAVFGLEVLSVGLIAHQALLPCLIASVVGDAVTAAWGVHHPHYAIGAVPALTALTVLKVAAAAVLFGWASLLFSELTHTLKKRFTALIRNPVGKSFAGGLIVIALTYAVGTRDYLGLGIPLLREAFEGTVAPDAFAWKILFTSLTLGTGFQGGEVTPLFVIGATLGHSLAGLLHVAPPFLAALGFVAVFSGAANTPIACILMGMELFGAEAGVYIAIACVISYLFSGHSGIYPAQRIRFAKRGPEEFPEGATLGAKRPPA